MQNIYLSSVCYVLSASPEMIAIAKQVPESNVGTGTPAFATVIPSLLLIIPNNNFGLTGAMSWVKSYNNEAYQPPSGVTVVLRMIFSMYTVMNIFNLMVYVILVGFWGVGGGGGGWPSNYREAGCSAWSSKKDNPPSSPAQTMYWSSPLLYFYLFSHHE